MNESVTYLSPEWLREATDAVRRSDELQQLAGDRQLGITQAVAGPGGETVYHLLLDGDSARLASGPSDPEHLRFSMDIDTAAKLASGAANAHELIISGLLRVNGDPTSLLDATEVFTALDAALAPLRARTAFSNEPETDPT